MKIFEEVGVKSVLTEDNKVSSGETTHGDIYTFSAKRYCSRIYQSLPNATIVEI